MDRGIAAPVASPPDDGSELGDITRPATCSRSASASRAARLPSPSLAFDSTLGHTIDRDEHSRGGVEPWTGISLVAAVGAAAVAIVTLLKGG